MSWRASGPYVPRPDRDDVTSPAGSPSWTPTVYVPGPEPAADELGGRISSAIRTHDDFPRDGVRFRDVMPVFRDPRLFDDVVDRLTEAAQRWEPGWIAAVESRGFLLGAPLASRLGLPLAPIRKEGRLPGRTATRRYELEYGTAELELQLDAVPAGSDVLLVDDLLATGGTLRAAAGLLEEIGARVTGMVVLVELTELEGRRTLENYNLLSLVRI